MTFVSRIKTDMGGTLLALDIEKLFSLYCETDASLALFQSTCGFTCPPGCGECCEHFDPDVIPAESDYAAAYIIYEKPSLLTLIESKDERKDGACIFYDSSNPFHCSIYPARALVCRLFAFSSVTNKFGGEHFHLCKKTAYRGKSYFDSEELKHFFPSPPPSMTEIGTGMSCMFPGSNGSKITLSNAVRESAGRIMSALRYADCGKKNIAYNEADTI
jgi:uncharacterized protein